MSKKKRKSKIKNTSTPHGGFTSAERHTHGMPQKSVVDKMSEKMETMASQLLVHPASSNPVVVQAAVSLAQIAWNRANAPVDNHETDAKLLAHVQQMISSVFKSPLKKELRETNVDLAVERLVQYKKKHFADDPREILAAILHPDEDVKSDFDARIRVHWTYPNAEQMRQTLTPSGAIDLRSSWKAML